MEKRDFCIPQSADIGSDHSLVMANVQLKGKFPKRPRMKGKQYDVGKLINDQKLAESFKLAIGEHLHHWWHLKTKK